MHSVGRRLGKGYDLCMSYTTASTESPTVVSQRPQGPVKIIRVGLVIHPSFVCESHRSKPAWRTLGAGSASGHNANSCNGMPGVCRRRPALAFRHLAGSDPKARSALQDRKAGSVPEAYTRVTAAAASRELADLPAAFSHR